MTLILASASPRRKDLLQQIAVDFLVKASDVTEDNNQALSPGELVIVQAQQKAEAVAREWFEVINHRQDVVIGADTIVVLDGKVYGKPSSDDEAFSMLSALSGRSHQVITGVAIVRQRSDDINDFEILTAEAITQVTFCSLSKQNIRSYIATGESFDKAGAYAIQGKGSLLVEKIEGDYTNVVGLPLPTLATLLLKVGVDLL